MGQIDGGFTRETYERCMWYALVNFGTWRPSVYVHEVAAQPLLRDGKDFPDNVVVTSGSRSDLKTRRGFFVQNPCDRTKPRETKQTPMIGRK